MTQDEIIRMAREAGFRVLNNKHVSESNEFVLLTENLERFAALVAANEREKWEQALPIAMDAMMLQEREACAKVCENFPMPKDATTLTHIPTLETCAAAIRARGEK